MVTNVNRMPVHVVVMGVPVAALVLMIQTAVNRHSGVTKPRANAYKVSVPSMGTVATQCTVEWVNVSPAVDWNRIAVNPVGVIQRREDVCPDLVRETSIVAIKFAPSFGTSPPSNDCASSHL